VGLLGSWRGWRGCAAQLAGRGVGARAVTRVPGGSVREAGRGKGVGERERGERKVAAAGQGSRQRRLG
jgi:hypothetical protein